MILHWREIAESLIEMKARFQACHWDSSHRHSSATAPFPRDPPPPGVMLTQAVNGLGPEA